MAQVPLDAGTNIQLTGGAVGASATSLYEVLRYEFGYAGGKNTNEMFAFIASNCVIENFHSSVRPANVSLVRESNHVRGFPVAGGGNRFYWDLTQPRSQAIEGQPGLITTLVWYTRDDGNFQFAALHLNQSISPEGQIGSITAPLSGTKGYFYVTLITLYAALFNPSFDGLLYTLKIYRMETMGVKGTLIDTVVRFYSEPRVGAGDPNLRTIDIPYTNKGAEGYYVEVAITDANFTYDIDYDFRIAAFGFDPFNTVEVNLNGITGVDLDETDQVVYGEDASMVLNLSWDVNAADLTTYNPLYMHLKVGTTPNTSDIHSEFVSASAAGLITLYEEVTIAEISALVAYGGTVYLTVEITDVAPA